MESGTVDKGGFQPTLPVRGVTYDKDDGFGFWLKFQPTLPVRGVTSIEYIYGPQERISTHTPRAGSDARCSSRGIRSIISTHTPRAGSDRVLCSGRPAAGFQPTLPVRGVTLSIDKLEIDYLISTHTPRAGSDSP